MRPQISQPQYYLRDAGNQEQHRSQTISAAVFHDQNISLESVAAHTSLSENMLGDDISTTTSIASGRSYSGSSTCSSASSPSHVHTQFISEDPTPLNQETTRSDCSNGRWRSPYSSAFDDVNKYRPASIADPITARQLWGYPRRREDITNQFRRFVNGDLHALPWSDISDLEPSSNTDQGSWRREVNYIQPELTALIEKKGYWTIAAQPAVDGVMNDHPVSGWGLKGEGYVFQKAFAEFFCPRQSWPTLRQRLVDAGESQVSWMCIDANGHFESTSITSESSSSFVEHDLNTSLDHNIPTSSISVVTWGVFRGSRIITHTIIDVESFVSSAEEAFSIWTEWASCFAQGSAEEQCLELCRQESIMVNVVGHQYIEEDGKMLWKLLLED